MLTPPDRQRAFTGCPRRQTALGRVSVLLALLLVTTGARAHQRTSEFTLDNGLRLLVQEDHRAPVVVSQVWYKVGSTYEQDGQTGLSHALEHMMFKRTRHLGNGEFSRFIAERGGQENAFTSSDYTTYYQTWSVAHLEESFRLEAERMHDLLLDEQDFSSERQVILEERRLRTDDVPQALAQETLLATAWQTSPARQPVIGWAADVEHLQLSDLRRWYERWYNPSNAIVVVVGDVDPQAVLALARTHFGPLKGTPVTPPPTRPEVIQRGQKRLDLHLPQVKVPEVSLAYKVPGLSEVGKTGPDGKPVEAWEIPALDVLAAVLDGGESARLPRDLVRGRERAVQVSADYGGLERLGALFALGGVPRDGVTLQALEQDLLSQIEALCRTPPAPAELERVKVQLKAQKVYERDSMFAQAMALGVLEASGFSWRLRESYEASLLEVTPAQVQAVARRYLVKERSTVAWLSAAQP